VGARQGLHLGRIHLGPVLEQAVQQQLPAIPAGVGALEVDLDGGHPVDLLVGLGLAVADRDHQEEALGVHLGYLREGLDEVEGPRAVGPSRLLDQPVVPGLELVQQQGHRLLEHHLGQEVQGGDPALAAHVGRMPTLVVLPPRVVLEQEVPQELVALVVQALADHAHAGAQGHPGDLRAPQSGGPGRQPLPGGVSVRQGVVERRHQVGLAQPPLAHQHHRPPVPRAQGLQGAQQVPAGVGDLQELGGGHLHRALVLGVGQLDGRAPEPTALELLAKGQSQHVVRLPSWLAACKHSHRLPSYQPIVWGQADSRWLPWAGRDDRRQLFREKPEVDP